MSTDIIQEYQNRLRDALAFIGQLKQKLEAAQRAKNEPIAIIGMACRFPGGGTNPEAYFRALEDGVDGIREVPEERWPASAIPNDQPEPRWAGLLDSVADFDASFFGISPREALSLDPQQRLLLEIVSEAIDDAGQRQDRLKGSRTGVYLGLSSLDYQERCFSRDLQDMDGFVVTGNMASTAAGRISFSFGLQGPCMIVDTACSSSLVAVHLASQCLRNQEADLALAGGVNLIMAPLPSYLMARLHALSADGRCKTFDAHANGYVRGEGCGIVVLKRLSDALRDGDRILALVRGSAINQDGRSTGLTTPNVLAQETVIRQALAMAKLSHQDIGYVETHGTGTPLGDPIEVDALRAVLGDRRSDGSPCILGAVKTNIGHLEAAAGIAGLIKTVQILRHQVIPRNLHFQARNPRIDIDDTALEFATATARWPRTTKTRYAGISSFGISGTNAHVILEEAPAENPRASGGEKSAYLLPLSAKSPEALSAQALSFAEWFSHNHNTPLQDVVFTASARRTHYEYRLAAVAHTREEFTYALRSFVQSKASPNVVGGRTHVQGPSRIVFVFSGQGSQWAGMGKALLDEEPAFRNKVEQIDQLVREHATFSLLDELGAPEETSRLSETEIVQPALFAIQVGLVELFKSWGIVPHAVIGHSVGEIAAAHVSGAISLEDAVRLVVLRGRIMQKATGHGKMVWLGLPSADTIRALVGYEDKLAIAAENDPASVVLSGDSASLAHVVPELERQGVVTRALRVNYAFHSPQMQPLADEIVATLGPVQAKATEIAMYSTVTGARIDGKTLDAAYWGRNVRETVNFARAVRGALEDGYRTFVEMGPHPVLLANLEECATAQNIDARIIATLRRQGGERHAILQAVGALHVEGIEIDWKKLCPNDERIVSLPAYAWQKERYWIDMATERQTAFTHEPIRRDELFYDVAWRSLEPAPIETAHASQTGTWFIFVDDQGVGDDLVARLIARGDSCIVIRSASHFERINSQSFRINPEKRDDFLAVFKDAFRAGSHCAGIVYLFSARTIPENGLNLAALKAAQVQGFLGVTYLVHAVCTHRWQDMPYMSIVTRGVMSVADEPMGGPLQSPVWGLGRTIDLEHPEIRCKRIDLDANPSGVDAEFLFREIATNDDELQVAIRGGRRYAARLVRTYVEPMSDKGFRLREDGTYLITGGLGGLGLSAAEWMARAGARHIALLGRRAPSEETRDAIRRIETSTGARVVVFQADITEPAAIAAVFAKLADTAPPLRGIVHAAGIIEKPISLLNIRQDAFNRAIAAKVHGSWLLHELSQNLDLDFFVLYSSVSAVVGHVGQASYAAGNAFLDALATWRHAKGLPAMSIQWGPFASAGMVTHDTGAQDRLVGGGMDVLAPEDNAVYLSRLLEHPRVKIALMKLNLEQWLRMFSQLAEAPYLRELRTGGEQVSQLAKPDTGSSGFLQTLADTDENERYDVLDTQVLHHIGHVLRMDPSRIDRNASFSSLGVDSLMSLELRNRLEPELRLKLPATLVFAYPTPAALIGYIFERLVLPSRLEQPIPQEMVISVQEPPAPLPRDLAAPIEDEKKTQRVLAEEPDPAPTLASDRLVGQSDVEARLAEKLAALDKYLD